MKSAKDKLCVRSLEQHLNELLLVGFSHEEIRLAHGQDLSGVALISKTLHFLLRLFPLAGALGDLGFHGLQFGAGGAEFHRNGSVPSLRIER